MTERQIIEELKSLRKNARKEETFIQEEEQKLIDRKKRWLSFW